LSAIDDVLELLKNGRWHDVREVVKKSRLHEYKVETILGFLAEYKFIALNKEQQKAKLNPTMFKFLKEIQRLNKKNTSSS
jgi:DNA-binding IclR family transcriptional regulator